MDPKMQSIVFIRLLLWSVAYLGGPWSPWKVQNRYTVKNGISNLYILLKRALKNAGNAVSETQISKNVQGNMAPDPLELCRHYGLPHHYNPGYATGCDTCQDC